MKTEELNGRRYLVLPVVMMTPGVRAGNVGPILHKAENLRASARDWNGASVVINHPKRNGEYVTATDDDRIGFMGGVDYSNGALRGKAYVDLELMRREYPELLSTLQSRQLEVSIGAIVPVEQVNGEYMGRKYIGIATNYTPDHLALLPDEVGACSWQDGCGVRVNSQTLLLTNAADPLYGLLPDDDDDEGMYPREYFPDEAEPIDPFKRIYPEEDDDEEN